MLLSLKALVALCLIDLAIPVEGAVIIPPVRDIVSGSRLSDHILVTSVAGDFLGDE